ncbi:hypothetical protein [Terrabacter carboxydivorans]|uniref:Uncharacterized protein n=1 Tax=Terrabacter carboxydivorans TaxID=619730 RepID=A0ABP5ZQJ5_9MICO
MSWRTLRPYAIAVILAAMLVVGVVGVMLTRQEAPDTRSASPASPASESSSIAGPPPSQAPAQQADPVVRDIVRLRAVSQVLPGTREPRITGDVTQQPDLYAAEFVRRLLTQDYRASRDAHVAWVQGESAQTTEPLVVGLVPKELRGRLAVFSVTESGGQGVPIPTANEWAALRVQNAYTTVRVQRVDEPLAWSTAVSSGRISDPGVTGREVAASVTLHYEKQGRPVTATSSVAITLNLQGPPTRSTWGFVTAVTYSSLPTSAP